MDYSFLVNYWFWSTVMLFILLSVTLFYLLRFARIILNIEDAVETSLDILDERYEAMSKILETPIFFDSVEVRQVIDNIRKSRDAILVIANILTQKISLEKNEKADILNAEENN